MIEDITPLVLTYNEAPNIKRCLEGLTWARRVVVLDSISSDETAALVGSAANAELHERKFDDHTTQWNHGLELVKTRWVLSLDADYVLTEAFINELKELQEDEAADAYYVSFRYCIFGERLRGSLYPPRAMLFRKDRCRYVQDGHTQLLSVSGSTVSLRSWIDHDDRKPFSRWLSSQLRYAEIEAIHLDAADAPKLSVQDRLRKMIILAPPLTLLYCLFYKGLVLDGWRGWYYTWQRVLAEIILSLCLLELKFRKPLDR